MTARYTVLLSKLAKEKFDAWIHADRSLGKQIAKRRLSGLPPIRSWASS